VAAEVIMPQLGMIQTDACLLEWLRADGDDVAEGEPVALIATDKADVEIESPAAGILSGLAVEPGQSAAVGTVIAYVLAPSERAPDPAGVAAPSQVVAAPPAADPPVSRARRVMAQRMAESFRTAPHLAVETSFDATAALAACGDRTTVTDLVLHAVAVVLRDHRSLNATFDADRAVPFERIDIGLAIDTDDGLLVPVLTGVDELELTDLTAGRAALVERARGGALVAGDLGDATFTVSNLGVFDVDAAWPVINPPGVAILAVGRARRQAVVVDDDAIVVRPVARLVLTADHRAVDGGQAARFLGALKAELEGSG